MNGLLDFNRNLEAYEGYGRWGVATSFITSASRDYAITNWVARAVAMEDEVVPLYPTAPIAHMLADSAGRVWALSGGWLFRRDQASRLWTRGPQVQGHRILTADDASTLYVVSSIGGISRVRGGDVSTMSFSGQLPVNALGMWHTPSGLAVLATSTFGPRVSSMWRLDGAAWTAQRLCPETSRNLRRSQDVPRACYRERRTCRQRFDADCCRLPRATAVAH